MDHKLKVKAIIDRNIRDIVLKNSNNKIGFVSVNKVEVSNDLSFVKVYVSFMNAENKDKSFKKLEQMSPYMRHQLAEKLSIYKTPEVRFIHDDRFNIDARMDELLKKDRKKIDKIKKQEK